MSDYRTYDSQGRPPIGIRNSYDLDAAQHFLADHAADLIVVFDHHAANPEVSIYVETPDGTLSAGDYYLWPLLHHTSVRIEARVDEMRRDNEFQGSWRYYYRGRIRKCAKGMPQLHNLIRIRGATIQALCTWDLDGKRPPELVVLNSTRDLTGMTRQEVLELSRTPTSVRDGRNGQ